MSVFSAGAAFLLMVQLIGYAFSATVALPERQSRIFVRWIAFEITALCTWPSMLYVIFQFGRKNVMAGAAIAWFTCGFLTCFFLGAPPLLGVMYTIVFSGFWLFANTSFFWNK